MNTKSELGLSGGQELSTFALPNAGHSFQGVTFSSLAWQECPSGLVDEETFKLIYAQFFPQGGESRAEAWPCAALGAKPCCCCMLKSVAESPSCPGMALPARESSWTCRFLHPSLHRASLLVPTGQRAGWIPTVLENP